MKKIGLAAAALAVFAFATVGCDVVDKDIEAIKELVLSDEVWFDAGSPEDSSVTPSGGVLAAADSLWLWIRGPQTHDTASISIEVVGDSAYVEWSRNNYGSINSFPYIYDEEGDSVYIGFWQKELAESASIRGIYRRTGNPNDSARGWTIEKISCAIGASTGTSSVRIDSIHIKNAGGEYDFTITDPLNTFYDVTDLVAFHSGEEVTVTLYTNDEHTVAFLHTLVFVWPVRTDFENMGGGVHQGTWNVQLLQNIPRFAIFDVMDSMTLYDETYPYDYSGVLFPYTIQ